jgi:hypothetical protein
LKRKLYVKESDELYSSQNGRDTDSSDDGEEEDEFDEE